MEHRPPKLTTKLHQALYLNINDWSKMRKCCIDNYQRMGEKNFLSLLNKNRNISEFNFFLCFLRSIDMPCCIADAFLRKVLYEKRKRVQENMYGKFSFGYGCMWNSICLLQMGNVQTCNKSVKSKFLYFCKR